MAAISCLVTSVFFILFFLYLIQFSVEKKKKNSYRFRTTWDIFFGWAIALNDTKDDRRKKERKTHVYFLLRFCFN